MLQFQLTVPTDIRFGAGRVSEVPEALAGLGASRVLVVTGRTTSRADAIRLALTEADISSVMFGVAAEPSIGRVRAAVALVAEAGCDAVLGFGGGSALDVAKAAAVLGTSGTDPLDHLEVIGAGRPIDTPGLPCVAVPTTAGTGSEVTRNSVLSGGGVKASLRSPLLLPKVAVVDPDLLVGVPRPTIATSGMDALSQLIEPLLSRRGQPVHRCAGPGRDPPLSPIAPPSVRGGSGGRWRTRRPCARQLVQRHVPGQLRFGSGPWPRGRGRRPALCTPWRRLRRGAGRGGGSQPAGAARARTRASALPRLTELATLLTGQTDASTEDAIAWLDELTAALSIPGLASYGLAQADTDAVVAAAQKASSMRGNPIELSNAEVSEIVTRSL